MTLSGALWLLGYEELGLSTHTHLTYQKHTHPFIYTDRNISKLNTYNTTGLFMKLKALFSLLYVQYTIDSYLIELCQQGQGYYEKCEERMIE